VSIFVDTSAIYAHLDASDARHSQAKGTFAELLDNEPLFTHNYVTVEAVSLVQSRLDLRAVRALVDDLLPAIQMVWVTEEVHGAATAALLAAGRRRPSFVDWVSFEVMRREAMSRAFAFDPDFKAQGFTTVP